MRSPALPNQKWARQKIFFLPLSRQHAGAKPNMLRLRRQVSFGLGRQSSISNLQKQSARRSRRHRPKHARLSPDAPVRQTGWSCRGQQSLAVVTQSALPVPGLERQKPFVQVAGLRQRSPARLPEREPVVVWLCRKNAFVPSDNGRPERKRARVWNCGAKLGAKTCSSR